MQEEFKVVERFMHRVDRRRYEGSLAKRDVACTNPVLGCAEFSGPTIVAADTSEQLCVDLPYQSKRERQGCKSGETRVHRLHIVDHLFDVAWQLTRRRVEFKCKDV